MPNKRRGHKHKPTPRINNARQGRLRIATVDSNGEQGTNKGHQDDGTKALARKPGRGGDSGKLLTNPKTIGEDLSLLERALRSRWKVKRKRMIRNRLQDIVAKQSVTIYTKAGPMEAEVPADINAIAAARVLAMMEDQDTSLILDAEKLALDKLKAGKDIQPNTVVTVNNVNIEPRQSEILSLAHKLGARELIIDGKPFRPEDIAR